MSNAAVHPAVSALSRRLLPEADQQGAEMAGRILAEVPYYTEGDLVSREQLVSSCAHNLRYVLGNLAGDPVSVDAPRATGSLRAQQGMPYAAVLQAFRVGGRFIWELLVEKADPEVRDVLLLAAADIWAVSDQLSSEVTDAYRATLAELAARDGQRRAVLVGTLLDGDTDVAEAMWESVAMLNLPRGADFVVVSAECPSPGTEGLPDVERLLRHQEVASAWRLDHDFHEGLVALRVGFGPAHLVETLAPLATARVGVSSPFPRVDGAHEARREARVAASAATPGTTDLVRYDEEPVAVLLAGAPDSAQALVRKVLSPVLKLPHEDCRVILDTARTWLAAAGSTSEAAKQLHVHRNTVRYRLRRLEELTGRDLSNPLQAAELYLALETVRIFALG